MAVAALLAAILLHRAVQVHIIPGRIRVHVPHERLQLGRHLRRVLVGLHVVVVLLHVFPHVREVRVRRVDQRVLVHVHALEAADALEAVGGLVHRAAQLRLAVRDVLRHLCRLKVATREAAGRRHRCAAREARARARGWPARPEGSEVEAKKNGE